MMHSYSTKQLFDVVRLVGSDNDFLIGEGIDIMSI